MLKKIPGGPAPEPPPQKKIATFKVSNLKKIILGPPPPPTKSWLRPYMGRRGNMNQTFLNASIPRCAQCKYGHFFMYYAYFRS